ncbi:hypothetical protein [Sphingopyxis flava]|uniref:Carbohydrate binding domain-containing protein n=1 Tax=Sphingopyxis flava TaxID=1507287 RepID=A0A1T4ZWM0_9SPHN|nr:hypothetical protein [Sphingopyxis flava]SKB27154.1 hypothetical protein SAMN06295937_1001275 [Sphingopyxis flava]
MFDGKAFGEAMLEAVRAYVDRATGALAAENKSLRDENAELAKRLAALEAREMPSLEGYATVEVAKSLITDAVSAAIAEIPVPQDGKSVDPEEVQAMVDKAVSALPAPEAPPDMAEIGKMIEDGIAKAVKALPPAEKGEPGIGLAGAMIDRDGNLVVTTSDGRTHNLGLVVGKDGKPGETFTLDDFDIEQTDERTLEFKFLRGDVMHTFELEFPVPIFREAYKEGRDYRKGDMVVWGGSLWAATKDTDAKPDSPDSGWMIAARKGRDGKSAKE